ncbi:MAG: hypothetical protein AAF639_08030 [Chloroflexota bacterium]
MAEKRTLLGLVGPQHGGYTFRLDPLDTRWIQQYAPERQRVSSVYIGFDKKEDISQIHESIWNQVFTMLTGLTIDEINDLGGIAIENPLTEKFVYNSLRP